MKRVMIFVQTCLVYGIFAVSIAYSQDNIPSADRRLIPSVSSRQTKYPLPAFHTRTEWLGRAKYLREHILVSTGLWPMPERTPLNAHIFGRIERVGYSVEKVYFESYPGFYVVGNLYRPLNKKGACPAILNPHGHWPNGRFEDSELASIPGRCINFALQGYVAFSYSMMGYDEGALQIQHQALAGDKEQLWGISPMGIQLWNSIRAMDFVTSLPDVDPNRVGVTGASGGGTQTFMLYAVDERVKVAAPVNMISLHMQGGCICENCPNLRLDASNVEIGALMAPRPLLLISTSGDWTCDTPLMEFPAIRNIYRLLDSETHVANVPFNYEHNYNKDSREAVYPWFARWLQPQNTSLNTKEVPFKVGDPNKLKVFEKLPAGAVTPDQLEKYLVEQSKNVIHSQFPDNWDKLLRFREVFGVAYCHSINASIPAKDEILSWQAEQTARAVRLYIGRSGKGDRIPAVVLYPADTSNITAATLLADSPAHQCQLSTLVPREGSLAAVLTAKGHLVLVVDPFPAGAAIAPLPDYCLCDDNVPCPTTYNRTVAAEAVQDILTGAAYLRHTLGFARIQLAGLGDAGLKVFLAAGLLPQAQSVAVDVNGFDNQSDEEFVKKLNIPLLRRAGDLTTAAALLAPKKLMLFNTGSKFNSDDIRAMYKAGGAEKLLGVETGIVTAEQIAGQLNR